MRCRYKVKKRTDEVITEREKIGWAFQGNRMMVTVGGCGERTEFDVVGDE